MLNKADTRRGGHDAVAAQFNAEVLDKLGLENGATVGHLNAQLHDINIEPKLGESDFLVHVVTLAAIIYMTSTYLTLITEYDRKTRYSRPRP